MGGKKLIGIDDFVNRIRTFESSVITRDAVLEYIDSLQLSDATGSVDVPPRCISIDLSGRPQSSVGACS